MAYAAQTGNSWFVVVDGKEEKHYDGVYDGFLVFSSDSKHVVYAAQAGNKGVVVVDGKEGKQFDRIVTLGQGKVVFDSFDSFHYLVIKGGSIYSAEERIKQE